MMVLIERAPKITLSYNNVERQFPSKREEYIFLFHSFFKSENGQVKNE